MLKSELRREALVRRRALSEEEVTHRSEALWRQLYQSFPVREWRWLHLFLPINRQKEPDTWPLIRPLWADLPALQLAVPVVQPDGHTLRHSQLMPETQLVNNRWDIPEPVGAAEVLPPQFDAILVPLLAFDEQGQRVGYGKGFYDHFLPQCRSNALRIGVSLEPPVAHIEDAWAGDVPLHACLTPERVWWFG